MLGARPHAPHGSPAARHARQPGGLDLVVSPRREARARRSARHTRVHVAHTRAADPNSRVAWRLCTPTCEPPRSRAPTRHGHTRVVSSHQMLTRRQPKRRCSLLTSPHIRQAIGLHRPEQKLLVALPSCTMRPSSLTVNSSVLQSGVALGEATAHGTDMNVELPMPRDTHEPPPDAQPMIMQQQQTSKKSV